MYCQYFAPYVVLFSCFSARSTSTLSDKVKIVIHQFFLKLIEIIDCIYIIGIWCFCQINDHNAILQIL